MCVIKVATAVPGLAREPAAFGVFSIVIVESALNSDIIPAFKLSNELYCLLLSMLLKIVGEREEDSSMAREISKFTIISALLLIGETNRTTDSPTGDSFEPVRSL